MHELEAMLAAELSRLGKHPARLVNAVPGNGGSVFNLSARLVDADEDEEAESVDLSWVYRNVGDYDQNGQVNVADLTPLALFWQQQAIYDDPGIHGGIVFWPSGNPLADGNVAEDQPPLPGSGAANWRVAQVDGDANGLVNLSDITPIAVHFGATVTSFGVYRREVETEEYSLVGTIQLPASGPGRPVAISYNDPLNVEDRATLWEYVVRPIDETSSETGPDSNPAVAVFGDDTIYPLAEMIADPTDGVIPLEVSFTAVTEAAPLGSIVNHEWDLDGDGEYELETGTGTEAQYIYESSGVYIARLRATDDGGRTAIAGQVITVGTAPVAVLDADPPGGEVPVLVTFDGRGSYSEFGSIEKYEWDLDGDGSYELDSGPVPEQQVEFGSPGSITVRLRVTDDIGLTAEDSLELVLADDYDEIEPNAVVNFATDVGAVELDAAPYVVRGNIGAGGYSGDQVDWYSFTVPSGCLLQLIGETAGLDPILRIDVIDANGVTVLASITNLESTKQVTRGLKGAGDYYLKVTNDHTITGLNYDYTLAMQISELPLDEVEDNDTAAQANALGDLDASIFPGIWGNLGPGGEDGDDDDWYSFSILSADDYSFSIDFFHRDADLELALHDAAGDVLFGVSESVTDRERIDVSLEPGDYTLRCYRRDGGNAYYQLSLFFTP